MATEKDAPSLEEAMAPFRTTSLDDTIGSATAADQTSKPSARASTDVRAAVQWNGSWKQLHDGTAIITRRYARALDKAGIPVFLPASGNFTLSQVDGPVRAEVQDLHLRTPRSQPVRLYHLVPTELSLRAALYPGGAGVSDPEGAEEQHRRKILLSVWEQMPVSSWENTFVAGLLRRFAHHVVACDHNRTVLLRAGVPDEQITVIHHPFSTADAVALEQEKAAFRASDRDAGHRPYRFYTMGKWEPRKDALTVMVAALLAARHLAGHGYPFPALTLGVFAAPWYTPPAHESGGYPSLETAIARAVAIARAAYQVEVTEAEALQVIRVDSAKYPSHVPVHAQHDAFVTASHGEAWGMPAHDAVVAGNVLLAPCYGGHAEYMEGPGVPFSLTRVKRDNLHLFGSVPAEWATVDPNDLAAEMVACVRENRQGSPLSERNFKRQSPAAVGKQLRCVVEKVIGEGYAWR